MAMRVLHAWKEREAGGYLADPILRGSAKVPKVWRQTTGRGASLLRVMVRTTPCIRIKHEC
eukprot:358262-Chlamydomonas_euryale.AAC.2